MILVNFCTFWRLKFTKLTKFRAPKRTKIAVIEVQNFPKLISRKIFFFYKISIEKLKYWQKFLTFFQDVDLYKLYRIVDRFGGRVRVDNRNAWRQVANKLGFQSNWGIRQVQVHYNRFLKSFEDFNRSLGCTMVKTSTPANHR